MSNGFDYRNNLEGDCNVNFQKEKWFPGAANAYKPAVMYKRHTQVKLGDTLNFHPILVGLFHVS